MRNAKVVVKVGGNPMKAELPATVALIRRLLAQGYEVVVVVSAPGRRGDEMATDTLAEHADGLDMDLKAYLLAQGEIHAAHKLYERLRCESLPAYPLDGERAGVYVRGPLIGARIRYIDRTNLDRLLQAGRVPVVAGFQGYHLEERKTAILERGGSDISAAAIAAALQATAVYIIKDVAGVFTADPALVPEARLIQHLPYYVAQELGRQGARVIHHDAVRRAKEHRIPIEVGATSWDLRHTRVDGDDPLPAGTPVALATQPAGHDLVCLSVVGTQQYAAEGKERLETILRSAGLHATVSARGALSLTILVPADKVQQIARAVHTELFPAEENAAD